MSIKKIVKHIGNNIIYYSGLGYFYSRIFRKSLRVINYHQILPKCNDSMFYDLQVTPENFEKQIRYLNKKFNIIHPDTLLCGEQIKSYKSPLVITFDDGTRDFYDYALPILEKFHITPLIFLISSDVGVKRNFWWDELNYMLSRTVLTEIVLSEGFVEKLPVRLQKSVSLGKVALSSNREKRAAYKIFEALLYEAEDCDKVEILNFMYGVFNVQKMNERTVLTDVEVKKMLAAKAIVLGSHTVSHRDMTVLSEREANNELKDSKKALEDKFDVEIHHFSFPGGFYSTRLRQQALDIGYKSVHITENKINKEIKLDKVGRISITGTDTDACFFNKVYGIFGFIYKQNKAAG